MRKASVLTAVWLALLAGLVVTAPAVPATEVVRTPTGTVTFDNATGTARLSLSESAWASFDATTAAAQPSGLYGFSADQATNGAGQTLRWELAVQLSVDPDYFYDSDVRYYLKLISNTTANFASTSNVFYAKNCRPSESCTIRNWGSGSLGGCPASCNRTSYIFAGGWHNICDIPGTTTPGCGQSFKSCATDFYAHFLSPDNYSVHRQRSSKWYNPAYNTEYTGTTCSPA
jgi:hypothetical protein